MEKKFDLVGFIMDYEEGNLDEEAIVEGFQQMIDSGVVWQLQGCYQRTANNFIEQRLCHSTNMKKTCLICGHPIEKHYGHELFCPDTVNSNCFQVSKVKIKKELWKKNGCIVQENDDDFRCEWQDENCQRRTVRGTKLLEVLMKFWKAKDRPFSPDDNLE